MKARRLVMTLGMLAICGEVFYRLGAVAAPHSDERESVLVRIAQAQLRLAELTLEKAENANQRVAGTLVGSLVSQLSDDVAFAKLQLKSATQSGGIDYVQAGMRRLELALRLAEGRLKRANDANQRTPETVKPLDLERLRLGVEIAKLRLESGRLVANGTPVEKLQWQIEMLNEELSSVKQTTYRLNQNRFQF